MNTIKRLTLTGLLALLVLTGCSATEGAESGVKNKTPSEHYTFWQATPSGQVLCVWAAEGYGSGVSCDWEHVK